MTLSIRTDRQLIRAGASSTRYVLVSFTAPAAPPRTERIPVNVALVLDRSGSMDAERKFALAREATERALQMLHPEDRFALVVYDQQVDVLAQSSFATSAAKRRALEALSSVQTGGSTDLCSGWMRGCEQIAQHVSGEGISRALLLTDGLANHGIMDRGTLVRHASELRRRGIATLTFGVGDDFDERLLRDMARESGGNFYFLESPRQIVDQMTSELGETLAIVARHATLEMRLPRGAEAEPLNEFRYSRSPGGDQLRVELGDLVSEQDAGAVIMVRFAPGEIGAHATMGVSVSAEGGAIPAAEGVVGWTYATHAENDRQPRDRTVDREVAALYAARARREATEANRVGNFEYARSLIGRTAERIGSYAGDDVVLGDIARLLRVQMPEFEDSVMMSHMQKAMIYGAHQIGQRRNPDGKARR